MTTREAPTRADAFRLFMEGSVAFARMERAGMRIDVGYLDRTIKDVTGQIADLEAEIKADPLWKKWRRRFGDKTSVDAKHQFGAVLAECHGHVFADKTATGRDKVDEKSLSACDHPLVPTYLRLQKLKKLLATHLTGVRDQLVGGYLRPFFHLHKVRTFRSSSSEINFQNVHSRDKELAETVRRAFIPREGHVLLEGDFKAVEVSMAAVVTQDPNLVRYVSDPSTDMHRDMATELFFLDKSQVDKKTTRDWAKNRFVFPSFYGSVYFQTAPHLWEAVCEVNPEVAGRPLLKHLRAAGVKELGDCGPKGNPGPGSFARHVRRVEEDFWGRRFRVYAACKRRWWEDYQRTGGFDLVTGFRCEGVYERNQVSNYKIQGPAFHCCLFTLIRLQRWLRRNKMRSIIVGQIHDCINVDAHRDEWRDVAAEMVRIVREDLPRRWPFVNVPMTIELELAENNWFEKKEVRP